MKKCSQCAEFVKDEALVCRFCGYEFTDEEMKKTDRTKIKAKNKLLTLISIIFLALIIFIPRIENGTKNKVKNIAKIDDNAKRKKFETFDIRMDGCEPIVSDIQYWLEKYDDLSKEKSLMVVKIVPESSFVFIEPSQKAEIVTPTYKGDSFLYVANCENYYQIDLFTSDIRYIRKTDSSLERADNALSLTIINNLGVIFNDFDMAEKLSEKNMVKFRKKVSMTKWYKQLNLSIDQEKFKVFRRWKIQPYLKVSFVYRATE